MNRSRTVGGYTLNPIGPQIDPRYPVYRPGTDPETYIGGDASIEDRNRFAGGMLNGYQNIPRAMPSYADMPGAGGDFYRANQGLLGNAAGMVAQPQAQSGLPTEGTLTGTDGRNAGGVQVVEPTDILTASPTDPNAPVEEAAAGSGLTNRDFLMMMGGAVGRQEGTYLSPEDFNLSLAPMRKSNLGLYNEIFGGAGAVENQIQARNEWLDSPLDREKALKAQQLMQDYNRFTEQGRK